MSTQTLPRLSRGFLPGKDPAQAFPEGSPLSPLDQLGKRLPGLLQDPDFRDDARTLDIPPWPEHWQAEEKLPLLRLYYMRLGFLASGYINQTCRKPATVLPENIAVPLCNACKLLGRQPILSYDGYALYNWRRLDPQGPIALGNIETIQNFVTLYDEHWFILVHVEIEALAAAITDEITRLPKLIEQGDRAGIDASLLCISQSLKAQTGVLKRIPERMDPRLYYKTFRPYIRFFENVRYEGVETTPLNQRGETGAQSSIMPTLVSLMKIPHQPSMLTNHLLELRDYMPVPHRQFIASVERLPAFRALASAEAYNSVLEEMAAFRRIHFEWAEEYINRHTDDPRGTGGTPYMQWLQQLIDETLAWRK